MIADILTTFSLTVLDGVMIPIGVVSFVIFWKVMEHVFWGPYLQLIEAREAATVGAGSRAGDVLAEAKKIRMEYDEKLNSARVAAVRDKLSKVREAADKAAVIVGDAEERAKDDRVKEREAIQSDMEELRRELVGKVEEMASGVVEKVASPLVR